MIICKHPRAIYHALKKAYGPQNWWPADTMFEVVLGAILTQNTSWTSVEKAIQNLKKEGPLTVGRLSAIPEKKLAAHLRPAGYFNLKARRLKNFIDFLEKKYGRSLKRLFREKTATLRTRLLSVNGIGPETADSIILYAAGKPIFVVDAYTRRIFSRLGLIPETADYEATQRYFLRALPRSTRLFNEYHALIVAHAKRHCRKKPACGQCPIAVICHFR